MKKFITFLKSLIPQKMIKVNLTTYSTAKSLKVVNGRIFVDGEDVTPIAEKITITVSGDVETINFDYVKEFNMTGNAGSVKGAMGDINITGNVTGKVKASQGDIKIGGSVTGDVENSMGDITAGSISGDTKTSMGDINIKK